MPYRLYEFPLGNLEGLPGITVTWTPVSNRAKSIYVRPLELVPWDLWYPIRSGNAVWQQQGIQWQKDMVPVILAFAGSHDFLSKGAPTILIRTLSSGAHPQIQGSEKQRLLLLKAVPGTLGAHTRWELPIMNGLMKISANCPNSQ